MNDLVDDKKSLSGINLKELTVLSLCAARKAGDAILKVYASDFEVNYKGDKSPLTVADRNSHEIIFGYLWN